MKYNIRILALFLCIAVLLSGCSISLESVGLDKLSKFIGNDPIICRVTAKDGQLLTMEVLSPDSHYDEGDVLYVQYSSITGAKSISVGDTVTFTYDYIEDVTVMEKEPFIKAESITPTEYIPPVTEEDADE